MNPTGFAATMADRLRAPGDVPPLAGPPLSARSPLPAQASSASS
jgi:hypothetical protein